MSENYYYSSLSGQEIEDTLVGAVRFNAMQGLTTSQKAQARQNIGAGEENTQIKIKGFYATLTDLQQAIPVGNEGDVYAVGTESPYDLYIWDAVNIRWVNNGPISFSDAIIDDNDISTSSAWSSAKTSGELAGKQDILTFDGSPVEGSTNPVTSGGLYNSFGAVQDAFSAVQEAFSDLQEDFTAECTFPKGGPAHFCAKRIGRIVLMYYQGPSTTWAVFDALVSYPDRFRPTGSIGQFHAPVTFNNSGVGTVAVKDSDSFVIINQVPQISGNTRAYFQIWWAL